MALSPGSFTPVDPQPADVQLDPLITPTEVAGPSRKFSASTAGLEQVCREVSGAIRDYCGWHIFPVLSIHDLIDGPGGRVLQLPTTYLRSVEALRWRGEALPVGSFRWSLSGFVEHEPLGDLGWPWPTVGSWPTGFRVLDVEFTCGYSTTPGAVLKVARALATRMTASPLGLTREQAGQVSLGFGAPELMASELADLDPYRIVGS
jgi:hypothetical protein